eukprot:5669107-Prymnesium_polylepis.1
MSSNPMYGIDGAPAAPAMASLTRETTLPPQQGCEHRALKWQHAQSTAAVEPRCGGDREAQCKARAAVPSRGGDTIRRCGRKCL